MEKIDFLDSEIQVTVRNTGPIPVEVVMADINDRIQSVIRTASNDFKVIVKPANYLIININILRLE